MLNSLTLHNFKAFEDESIQLANITVLVGPNNSGKSSIIAALRLLAQTMDSPDPDVPLLLNGIYGDFGTYRDVVFGNHRGRPIIIGLGFSGKLQSHLAPLRGQGPDNLSIKLQYKFRTMRRELILREFDLILNQRTLLSTAYSTDSERHLIHIIDNANVPSAIKSYISKDISLHHFLPDFLRLRRILVTKNTQVNSFLKNRNEALNTAYKAMWIIRDEFRNFDYLGPMRIAPSRTYQFTGEKRRKIGMHGENVAGIIAMDWAKRGRQKMTLASRVGDWLKKARIADKLEINPLSDRHYEIRVSHPLTGESQNLADVGYGSSQVIPVLVGGYNSVKGDVFMIEEPEIHLHPYAQAELGDFFAELYDSGIQTIIETHSEHMILRIQQHVAAGRIKPDDIKVYYVYPYRRKKKRAIPLHLNTAGKFIDKWPEGFFPERLNEAKRLSQIRNSQLVLPFKKD